jgi:hypothetical protein
VLVYTCKNHNCKKYLIDGIALCKVVSKSGEASLDLETGEYTPAEDEPLQEPIFCFHCRKPAMKSNMQPQQHEKNELLKDLDTIESEIDELMKIMGCL